MENLKLFNPDYLKHLCQKFGLRPSSKYGQNFLINPEVIDKMVEAAEVTQNDTIIEVGPGFGVLTLALAEKARKVISFEIERKLEKYWENIIESPTASRGDAVASKINNLEIVWGDVLRSFALLKMTGGYKVVANLPYQITSNIIRKFLEAEYPPESMTLMVQKEVAERICAEPGQMSLLSISVQYYADAEIILQAPRFSFWPEPKVDSAVVRIKNKDFRIKNEEFDSLFFKFVKAGFAQKRKLLIKNLEPFVGKRNKDKLKGILADLGLLLTVRAQELSVDEWKQLVKSLKSVMSIKS